jgi:hypothetical protein
MLRSRQVMLRPLRLVTISLRTQCVPALHRRIRRAWPLQSPLSEACVLGLG